MGLAVALNVVLNLLLIPIYGILGAAAATATALAVEAGALCLMARRTLGMSGMALAPRSAHGTAAQ
jgi:O-antigen/teichoic acid export membrane protein